MSDQENPADDNVVEFRRKTDSKPSERAKKRASAQRSGPVYSVRGSKYYAYRLGDNVACIITKASEGGYDIVTRGDNLPGYLPTNAKHKIGEEVLATFVCIDKNRMLMSERFTHGEGDLLAHNDGLNLDEDDQSNE